MAVEHRSVLRIGMAAEYQEVGADSECVRARVCVRVRACVYVRVLCV